MPEIVRMPSETKIEEILAVVARDGAMILENVLDATRVEEALEEVMPYVAAVEIGHDD
jgi:hypothetical protein